MPARPVSLILGVLFEPVFSPEATSPDRRFIISQLINSKIPITNAGHLAEAKYTPNPLFPVRHSSTKKRAANPKEM